MIKNIIFDIGGVLVGLDWVGYIRKFGFSPEKESAVTNALIKGPVWKELDRGELTMEELLERFMALAPEEYRNDVREVFLKSGAFISKRAYAKQWIMTLKEYGYHTYYLSNYSAWMIEESKKALDFLPLLDGGVFSCEVKQIKPDDDIYHSLLSRYPEIIPEESVFIDDTLENIETANRLGFHTIHFQSQEQAETELTLLLNEDKN